MYENATPNGKVPFALKNSCGIHQRLKFQLALALGFE